MQNIAVQPTPITEQARKQAAGFIPVVPLSLVAYTEGHATGNCASAFAAFAAKTPVSRTKERRYAQAIQIRRESSHLRRWRCVGCVRQAKSDPPEPLLYAEMVGEAAAQVVSEDQTAARLAARNRFVMPALYSRDPQGNSGWQA